MLKGKKMAVFLVWRWIIVALNICYAGSHDKKENYHCFQIFTQLSRQFLLSLCFVSCWCHVQRARLSLKVSPALFFLAKKCVLFIFLFWRRSALRIFLCCVLKRYSAHFYSLPSGELWWWWRWSVQRSHYEWQKWSSWKIINLGLGPDTDLITVSFLVSCPTRFSWSG